MEPNLDEVYAIIRGWALRKTKGTYTQLSHEYKALTNDWFEPHGSWDQALGRINNALYSSIRAPALSAVVVLIKTGEPGGDFWGCCPSVPPRPRNDLTRTAEWGRILNDVFKFSWPEQLPTPT